MLYDDSIEWVHYLTRPFSLFGASLWQRWYDSKQIFDVLGSDTPDGLLIEEHLHVVRYYKEKEQLRRLQDAKDRMIRDNLSRLKEIFGRGSVLNAEAEAYLHKGWESFTDLQQAVDFIIDLTLHATVVPAMVLGFSEQSSTTSLDEQVIGEAQTLRSTSYYPRFLQEIIMPHVRTILERHSLTQEGIEDLVTLQEVADQDFRLLPERLAAREYKRLFVYQVLHGTETIIWVPDTAGVINTLEGLGDSKDVTEIQGQTAYKGKVRGTARLVLSNNDLNHSFDTGDILVSVNSNPTLMPFILKSAAIVTDEGGVATHAAIISRELKKPCVTGTKIATKVIQEGDIIEVDADKGIVKIITI